MAIDLQSYLVSDRQWPRHLRLAHAKYQRQVATTPEEKTFWKKVFQANICDYRKHYSEK